MRTFTPESSREALALGAVGYFMVTGTHVFPGRSPIEVCGHHLHTKPEPPSARLGRACSPDIESLLVDCLEKDPSRRPQTAAEVQQRVRECRAYGAWDRERARHWWQENAEKLGRGRREHPTFTRVEPLQGTGRSSP